MLATEWKLEDALRVREEESLQRGIQIGRQEGEQIGRKEGELEVLKLFDAGYSAKEVRERLKAGGTPQ
jgi:hypothetical protein